MSYHDLLTVHASRHPNTLARDFLVVGQYDSAEQQGQVGIDGG